MRHLLYSWAHFFSQSDILMLFALSFDCFFGIGTASLTYLIWKIYDTSGYVMITIFWATLIKFLGYDYVLFNRAKDVEYLYEKNTSRKLDILFSICVSVANFYGAAKFFSEKLQTCERCEKKFQQSVSISEYICVCVCQKDCKRLAKYCEKCKSANLTIKIVENVPKYRILLVVPFIAIMVQHLMLLLYDQVDPEVMEKAKNLQNYHDIEYLDDLEYLIKLEKVREFLEAVVDNACRFISGLLFFYIIIRVIHSTYTSLTSSLPNLPKSNEKTRQIDEDESHSDYSKALSDLKELVKSQQEEQAKRTKKLLQQQVNENERQDNIEKKLNNQKQTFVEQFEELRSQCMDIKTKIENQEKQQELVLKLVLDLSKEGSSNGSPS